jgi:hypothetical protein
MKSDVSFFPSADPSVHSHSRLDAEDLLFGQRTDDFNLFLGPIVRPSVRLRFLVVLLFAAAVVTGRKGETNYVAPSSEPPRCVAVCGKTI